MAAGLSDPVAGVFTSSNAATYAFTSFTPTAGSLLVFWVFGTGLAGTGSLSNTGTALTWVQQGTIEYPGGLRIYCFTAQVPASVSASVITFATNGASASGCGLCLQVVTGHDKGNPIRQVNSAWGSSSTPSVTFGSIAENSGVQCGGLINNAVYFFDDPSGWGYTDSDGWGTPNCGLKAVYGLSRGGENAMTSSMASGSAGWAVLHIEVRANRGVVAKITQFEGGG